MPMLRAVPSTIRIAASMFSVLRSTSFVWAISRTCCRLTLPILSLCVIADALAIPAARLSRTAARGVVTTHVNDRSVDDPHLVAALEDGLRLGLLRARFHLTHDLVDLILTERHRARAGTDEAGHLGRRAHELPRLVRQLHFHEHVAGEELLLG